jgi:hypothetical protein
MKSISEVINKYEVYAAVALCFPNILNAIVVENANLSSDKIGRRPTWSNFLSLVAYIRCQQCIFQPHLNFICTFDLEVFNQ